MVPSIGVADANAAIDVATIVAFELGCSSKKGRQHRREDFNRYFE